MAGGLWRIWYQARHKKDPLLLLTVKAPGTEKMTTFLPFHWEVLSLMADHSRQRPGVQLGNAALTNTAGKLVLDVSIKVTIFQLGTHLALKLGGVGNIVEGGLGDGVTDFDCGGHCQVMRRLGTWMRGLKVVDVNDGLDTMSVPLFKHFSMARIGLRFDIEYHPRLWILPGLVSAAAHKRFIRPAIILWSFPGSDGLMHSVNF